MHKFKVLLLDAVIELMAQKLRTFLTLLGMIFGVGAVIAMLNIGEGAEREALKLIDQMGLNNLIVNSKSYSGEELKEVRKESLGLTISDVDAAKAVFPFVENASTLREYKVYALYSDNGKFDGKATAVSSEYFALSNATLASGRFLAPEDDTAAAQVAVIGYSVAKALFPDGDAIGRYIKLNHLWLEVIGVLQAKNLAKDEFQGVKLGGDSDKVFVPMYTAKQKLKSEFLSSEIDSFKLQISKGTEMVQAAKAVEQLLNVRHGGVQDYELVIPSELLAQQKQTQQIFNIVMACVAGISLLVGGIGIMNIMLANVLERTKEIGLLRAVGATQMDIRQQFLAESFVISALGGTLGIIFGLVLSEVIAMYSNWAVGWSLFSILLSLSICMLVGMGFGVFPAIKASKLNPIEALHSD